MQNFFPYKQHTEEGMHPHAIRITRVGALHGSNGENYTNIIWFATTSKHFGPAGWADDGLKGPKSE